MRQLLIIQDSRSTEDGNVPALRRVEAELIKKGSGS